MGWISYVSWLLRRRLTLYNRFWITEDHSWICRNAGDGNLVVKLLVFVADVERLPHGRPDLAYDDHHDDHGDDDDKRHDDPDNEANWAPRRGLPGNCGNDRCRCYGRRGCRFRRRFVGNLRGGWGRCRGFGWWWNVCAETLEYTFICCAQ